MTTANDLLKIAQAEVGYSRWTDPEPGTKYGRWYEKEVDKNPNNYNFGGSGVAYCAMFVSWCLYQSRVTCKGLPNAYCPSIHNHEHLKPEELRRGDVVTFDWQDDGTDDHVGFVVSNDGRNITTIEGNTNNGKVCNRTRPYSTICGGIRPNYDGNSSPQPVTKPATSEVSSSKWPCKGWKGSEVTRLQKALVTLGYSVGSAGVDGDFGKDTDDAVRKFQRDNGLEDDGIVGTQTQAKLYGSSNKTSYTPGEYTLIVDLVCVRTGAGRNNRQKTKKELTADGQKHSNENGCLRKGTNVTVQEVSMVGSDAWGRIPSGWIALNYKGSAFVRKR